MKRLVLLACLALLPASGALAAGHEHPAHAANGSAPPLFDNLGTLSHRVTTSSPQAQRYFDQGLRLTYAFNHDEAIRAFKEAARLDPNCAMAWWGVALALGPNINLDVDSEREQAAYQAITKAKSLEQHVSPGERAYIEALSRRYYDGPNPDLKKLNRDYADAMRALAQRYPGDPDAATLFAESMLDLRPWDNWTRAGKPQPGTLEVVATLEGVLKAHPDHPGANHYYIHAVEASPHPERALAAADRLRSLMPGAGHLVHMPSHIYIRTGRYYQSAEANRRAIAADRAYLEQVHPTGAYPMMYYPHNIQFLYAASCMEGTSAQALGAARELSAIATPAAIRQMPVMEFVVPVPLFALARFGRWTDILKEPAPSPELRYSSAIWHYARGLAFAATGHLDQAAAEARALDAVRATIPRGAMFLQNSPNALLAIAAATLKGEIAVRQGKADDAIGGLRDAVALQDALNYEEPPAWYYPVRETLGAELLAAGLPAEAEAVYREDLKENPESPWSLDGLVHSLRAQKRDTEADAARKRLHKAWAHADAPLPPLGS